MVLGILQFDLHILAPESLKDKRRVVKSVKDKLHREHLVSVAEVAHHDALNVARMAVVCVGVDGQRVGEVLDAITHKLRSMTAMQGGELGDTYRQIIRSSELEGLAREEEGERADGSGTKHDRKPFENPHAMDDEMLRRFDEPD